MVGVSKLLSEALVEKAEQGLRELGSNGTIAIKLKAIVAAKAHGIARTALFFGITKATLFSWIHCLQRSSADYLVMQSGRGRRRKLSKEQEAMVRQWAEGENQLTIDYLRIRFHEELGMELGRSTVHRLMQRLGFA